MPAQHQRISIGFQASPPVALRITDEEFERFKGAMGGEGWFDLDGEDGVMRISLAHVLWVKRDKDEQRGVGFGAL